MGAGRRRRRAIVHRRARTPKRMEERTERGGERRDQSADAIGAVQSWHARRRRRAARPRTGWARGESRCSRAPRRGGTPHARMRKPNRTTTSRAGGSGLCLRIERSHEERVQSGSDGVVESHRMADMKVTTSLPGLQSSFTRATADCDSHAPAATAGTSCIPHSAARERHVVSRSRDGPRYMYTTDA